MIQNRLTCLLFMLTSLAFAQLPKVVSMDPKVATQKAVLGFDFGEQITMSYEALAYAEALAHSSERVIFRKHGKTWEGRNMALLFVSSPKNLARLEEFQKRYQAIADPRTTNAARFQELSQDLPVLAWLDESVHGDEVSGTDSGLMLAYYLASAKETPAVDQVLDQVILMIELMQNPDGRDWYVTYSRKMGGLLGNEDNQSAAFLANWPEGRFNHYNFDMNRDWFAQTQVESKIKAKTFLEWFPQVTVDLHEMSLDATFFAANPAPPTNPLLPEALRETYEALGKKIGEAFDREKVDYFQGESFDSFYPGYGESWPSLHGSVGVLFEQGGVGGPKARRNDGILMHYLDAVNHQALASHAVIEYCAHNRASILSGFYQNRSVALGWKEDRQIVLMAGADPARLLALGELLRKNGIEVVQLTQAVKGLKVKEPKGTFRKVDVPALSLLVSLDQPAGIMAKTLLSPHFNMDSAFIDGENKRYSKREESEIYDVTAWSLPLAYGVQAELVAGAGIQAETRNLLSFDPKLENPNASVGFFVPYTNNTGAILAWLFHKGIRVHVSMKSIQNKGRSFAAGTLVLKAADNPPLQKIAAELHDNFAVDVVGIDRTWFESGPSFGSSYINYLKPPKIGLLWDRPTDPLSAGWVRYLIEQGFDYEVTPLLTRTLAQVRLREYQVLILPDLSGEAFENELGNAGLNKLKAWVDDGGVLIGIAGACEWLTQEKPGFLTSALEHRDGQVNPEADAKETNPNKVEPKALIEPRVELPRRLFGVFLDVNFDTEHWLAYGMNPIQAVLVDSNRVFRPLRLDMGVNVGRFAEASQLIRAGFAPEESSQFALKAFAMVSPVGKGLVIGFSEDLNYRGFMEGLKPLMTNALMLAPSFTRP